MNEELTPKNALTEEAFNKIIGQQGTQDLHKNIAAYIYDCTVEQVTDAMRKHAKKEAFFYLYQDPWGTRPMIVDTEVSPPGITRQMEELRSMARRHDVVIITSPRLAGRSWNRGVVQASLGDIRPAVPGIDPTAMADSVKNLALSMSKLHQTMLESSRTLSRTRYLDSLDMIPTIGHDIVGVQQSYQKERRRIGKKGPPKNPGEPPALLAGLVGRLPRSSK
jgi:hypothetical protein